MIRFPAAVLVMALHTGCSDGHATVAPYEIKVQPAQKNNAQDADEDKTSDNVIRHTPLYY
jgi:hypothetical protein